MSGGTYSYAYRKLDEFIEDLNLKGRCSCASPVMREKFRRHLKLVSEAMRAIEWNDSGDGDDKETIKIRACLR